MTSGIKLLALDTSTEACSAALFHNGQFFTCFTVAPRRHTTLILPMLEELLTEAGITLAQLDALALGCGPGSFTGIRIAASAIQGIAFAYDFPVVPVSTLRALAQGAYREWGVTKVLSSIDAHMKEIYWGVYSLNHENIMTALTPDIICAPDQVLFEYSEKNWCGVGSGWDNYSEILTNKISGQLQQWLPQQYPAAQDIAALAVVDFKHGKAVNAEQALPIYLRDKVVR